MMLVRLRPKTPRRLVRNTILLTIGALVLVALSYSYFFGPASSDETVQEFIVAPGTEASEVSAALHEQEVVRSGVAMSVALAHMSNGESIRPGAYDLRASMDVWHIAKTLMGKPRMVFVTFPPGIRKEQIGEILSRELGWNEEQIAAWQVATTIDPDFVEGVYYPDTYLIPTDQSPEQIASRMRGRFMEVFAPYAKEAQEKGIAWEDALILASIIDREAGVSDKELVAGILWNRINTGMRLQADATLQYAKGVTGAWWSVPKSEDKSIESKFNTYKYSGLPPHPINNPSLASISAALNPEETPCLYYLHGSGQQIYCSITYSEHKQNVDSYLR